VARHGRGAGAGASAHSGAARGAGRSGRLIRDRGTAVFLATVAALTALRLAMLWTSTAGLHYDEAQYWVWAQDPAWGYFSKPPMVAWLIALAEPVCGSGAACVRSPAPLLWAGTALATFGVGAALFGRRVGVWAGWAALLAPGAAFSARILSTDVPLLLFWALALLAWVRLRAGGGVGWATLLAGALGLGLLSKYAMLYFYGCVAVAAVADPASRRVLTKRAAVAALAVGLTALIPNLLWNLEHGGATVRHTAANASGAGLSLGLADGVEFVAAQFALAGPVILTGLILAAVRPRMAETRLLLAFSLPIFLVVTGLALLTRAHGNWAATALIATFVLGAAHLLARERRGWLAGALALGAAAQAGLFLADANAARLSIAGRAPYAVALGWEATARAVAETARAQGAVAVVTERRRDAAALTYHLRGETLPVLAWPGPGGVPDDHFQMSVPATGREAGPLLIVAGCASPERIAAAAEGVASLGPRQVATGPGEMRTVWLFRADRARPGLRPPDCP
jgi:4-amino-4-deoxy-L-arabinose transferase-like glycosyltransferase